MQSQRELFERQIELEREELRVMPEQEEAELAALYRRKGIPDADARRMAHHLMADPDVALDTKVREGLASIRQLGSPGARPPARSWPSSSAPRCRSSGICWPTAPAFIASLGFSLLALFLVGAAVSLLTGKSAWRSSLRQMGIGGLAAAVTFAVGSLIGVAAS
jgi:VIT1/CCC1 family predicted Fe2+/Mn2+ transporter